LARYDWLPGVPVYFKAIPVVLACLSVHGTLLGQSGRQESSAALRTNRPVTTPDLPDAPDFATAREDGSAVAADSASSARTPRFYPAPIAPQYHKYIEPGQTAQPLVGLQKKMIFSLNQIASPYMFVSIIAAAGYEHAVNGSPNFGTDLGAFGQRLGAATIRDTSQSIFSDGLMPTLLHQDPRYYVMGRRRNLFVRGGYAISRVFITKSDSGDTQVNFSLFAGHAATSILENAYYPSQNQGVSETVKGFGGSFAGAALSNSVREFLPDLLHLAHLE